MKFSIWQWIGAVLLIIGLIWYAYDRFSTKPIPPTPPGTPTPAVAPLATQPTSQPA